VAHSSKRSGIFFILVAPAGAGKNRLIEAVVERVEGLRQLPTATTRPMRPGEQQNREHVFVSEEEFQQLIESGALLEHQLVHGIHYYGMLREKIDAALDEGASVIADIEVIGTRIAQSAYPENTVTIFIQPPSIGSLVERMRNRKERETEIARRLMRVPMELAFLSEADYVVINDNLSHAADSLSSIITAERSRPSRQTAAAQFHYAFHAQVVALCGEEALHRETGTPLPEVVINEGEAPHVAAARALSKAFGSSLPSGAWVYGGEEVDGFMPPITLQTSPDDGNDHVTFVYHYRLAERLDPPRGWVWGPLPTDPEPAAEGSHS
jgi:guanylate kinase